MAETDPRSSPTVAEPDPSTVFAFWADAEAPLEEEVRLALRAAWPDVEQIDELEPVDGVLWGGTWRIPLSAGVRECVIWAEARGDLADGFLEDGLGAGSEYELSRKAGWLLGVEMRLDAEAPQRSFQEQLQILEHVAVPGLPSVYDDNALVFRSGRHIRDLIHCAVPPRASSLYAVHTVEGDGGVWQHTHGLRRLGFQELDLVGLPAHLAEDGRELLEGIVDGLLAGLEVGADGLLEVGMGLSVRLVPLEIALSRMPKSWCGGSDERDGDPDHGEGRLVVLDSQEDRCPLGVLARIAADGALFKSRMETERQRSLSLSRWGTFGQLFALHRQDPWRFHVKLAYEQGTGAGREHLWFEVEGLKPGFVRARLVSAPMDVPTLVTGDVSWEPLDRLTDWVIVTPEGPFDPESAPALLEDRP